MTNEKTVVAVAAPKKREVTEVFKWCHATSVNGGAMLIAAVIASYF